MSLLLTLVFGFPILALSMRLLSCLVLLSETFFFRGATHFQWSWRLCYHGSTQNIIFCKILFNWKWLFFQYSPTTLALNILTSLLSKQAVIIFHNQNTSITATELSMVLWVGISAPHCLWKYYGKFTLSKSGYVCWFYTDIVLLLIVGKLEAEKNACHILTMLNLWKSLRTQVLVKSSSFSLSVNDLVLLQVGGIHPN